jgi:S-disulfanyl-L-cysteine oxidoreductase SoxD
MTTASVLISPIACRVVTESSFMIARYQNLPGGTTGNMSAENPRMMIVSRNLTSWRDRMSLRAASTRLLCAGTILLSLSSTAAVVATQGKNSWDGVYTAAQATRGAATYKDKCARCHAEQLTGNDAPSLVGGEFCGNWNGQPLGDLFDRIRISMPDDAKGTLTRPEAADLVALILQKNEMPGGQAELPTDAAALAGIKFLGSKP